MPDVAPFAGIRYAPAHDPAAVTAPPYDVITPRDRVALEAASPYNVVRLILGPLGVEEGKYEQSRALMDRWTGEGVLVADAQPALYVYEERFRLDGALRRQTGFLAAVRIADDVLPHERVMGPVVEDRLAVIRATEANLSPVFCLYWSGDEGAATAIEAVSESAPYADFTDSEGIGHKAWLTSDSGHIAAIQRTLMGARVVIADGHHRYRTAEAYRDERREQDGEGPWDRMLLYMVDAERHGPALLPIHRLVSGLPAADLLALLAPVFDIQDAGTRDADELAAAVAGQRPKGRCYGILAADGAWIAALKDESAATQATAGGGHCDAWRDLDVAVLHTLVFDRLWPAATPAFVHHPAEAAEAVESGEASLAVLLAPTPTEAVRAIAEAGDSMPPKSTFFIPKPRTGIVIRSLRSS